MQLNTNIVRPTKNELLFLRHFLGDKFQIIEILYTVIQVYYLHFNIISEQLVATYASIAK